MPRTNKKPTESKEIADKPRTPPGIDSSVEAIKGAWIRYCKELKAIVDSNCSVIRGEPDVEVYREVAKLLDMQALGLTEVASAYKRSADRLSSLS
jgi:hypothetical protein